MADPSFPFEIGRRDGRLTRPIMCRRCARWTAFDGTRWRHADGTEACVDPEALHNQQPTTKEATMATKTKAAKGKQVRTNYGKASVMGALPETRAPKGLSAKQQAEFDRAAKRRAAKEAVQIPAEFQSGCELVPQPGLPFGSAQERTNVTGLVKRATAFAKEAGIAPESIDLISLFNNYINHTNTESRKPTMSTKATKGNTTTKRAASNGTSAAITEAEIDAFVAAHEKSGGKMTKGAIVDAIRASGAKIGYPGGDYLVKVLAKRPKATTPAEKPATKAAAKPAAKGAAKKPARAEGNLTRTTVNPIPKKGSKKTAA